MESTPFDDLELDAAIASQLSYHVRMSAVFAVAGDHDESASESVLAWALLDTAWPAARTSARACADELIGDDQAGVSPAARDRARAKAHDLAMTLEAHFVSVGQRDVASLYERVAERLADTVDELVPAR